MKMKRDDLIMVILTIIVVLGGLIYYVAAQLSPGTSVSKEGTTSGTAAPVKQSTPMPEPVSGDSTETSPEPETETEGQELSPSLPTVQVVLNSLEQVIGGTLNGNWIDARTVGYYLKGGEVYQYYLDGECMGERAAMLFDPEADYNETDDTYSISMQEGLEPITAFTFALTGNWNPFLRKAKPVGDTRPYIPVIQKLMEERSIASADAVIRKVERIDVEGDGTYEYLIVASNCTEEDVYNIANDDRLSREGKYSFVVLEKAGEEILLFERLQSIHDVAVTCADLDGDGKIEFFIHDEDYEPLAAEGYSIGYDAIIKVNGTMAAEVAAVTSTPQ